MACFTYNIDEVNSILEAYKQSLVSKSNGLQTIHSNILTHMGTLIRWSNIVKKIGGPTCRGRNRKWIALRFG